MLYGKVAYVDFSDGDKEVGGVVMGIRRQGCVVMGIRR